MENNNLGQVKISNEVIVTIAGLAALEVENVETITTITDKLLKNNGVKIQIDEEQIILDIIETLKKKQKKKKQKLIKEKRLN